MRRRNFVSALFASAAAWLWPARSATSAPHAPAPAEKRIYRVVTLAEIERDALPFPSVMYFGYGLLPVKWSAIRRGWEILELDGYCMNVFRAVGDAGAPEENYPVPHTGEEDLVYEFLARRDLRSSLAREALVEQIKRFFVRTGKEPNVAVMSPRTYGEFLAINPDVEPGAAIPFASPSNSAQLSAADALLFSQEWRMVLGAFIVLDRRTAPVVGVRFEYRPDFPRTYVKT